MKRLIRIEAHDTSLGNKSYLYNDEKGNWRCVLSQGTPAAWSYAGIKSETACKFEIEGCFDVEKILHTLGCYAYKQYKFTVVKDEPLEGEAPKTELELVEQLRLIRVNYGNDTGLVALTTGTLIMSTWDTSRVSVMSSVPAVDLYDDEMTVLFDEEHGWEEVILLLQQNYNWAKRGPEAGKSSAARSNRERG